MAKAYRALSNIEHGEDKVDSDGQVVNEVTHIPYGAIVEGLSAAVMKNLWDAGVLEEVETSTPVVTRTSTPVVKADDSGAASGQSGAPPAAPNNTQGVSPSTTGDKA